MGEQMSKIEHKTVAYMNIGDFIVEADVESFCGEKTYNLWLCRGNYGVKSLIFGVPAEEYKDLHCFLFAHDWLLHDRNHMEVYIESLLESGEYVDEKFRIYERRYIL